MNEEMTKDQKDRYIKQVSMIRISEVLLENSLKVLTGK